MMISTVTTSTVSVLTTAHLAGSLVVISIMILLALLVQKEIATAAANSRRRQFNQVFNIGVVPLLIAFILIVFFNLTKMLN